MQVNTQVEEASSETKVVVLIWHCYVNELAIRYPSDKGSDFQRTQQCDRDLTGHSFHLRILTLGIKTGHSIFGLILYMMCGKHILHGSFYRAAKDGRKCWLWTKTIFSVLSSGLKYSLDNPKWYFLWCTLQIFAGYLSLQCRPIIIRGQYPGAFEIKRSGLWWHLWPISSGVKLYSDWFQLEVVSEKLEKYPSPLGYPWWLIFFHPLHMHED